MDVDIDWSKAPEGATHYTPETHEDNACWISYIGGACRYVTASEYKKRPVSFVWLNGNVIDDDELFIPKPQPTPTFTQEMSDNGVLPSVGMECEFITTFFSHEPSNTGTGTPIAYHGNKVWFSTGSKEFVINLNVITFKPLTPPITLIDGKAYSFESPSHGGGIGYYESVNDQFVNINLGISAEFCTNIQPLTVEASK